MCNGITKTGKQCSRKAEWCSQHDNQKPAEPVAIDMDDPYDTAAAAACEEQKNELPELIETEKKIVSENIVSPMSPNATSASSPQPDSPIVDEGNIKPIQKIFNTSECFIVHHGAEYQYWIDKCAIGKAYSTYKLTKPNGEFWHDTKGCRVIQTVKYGGKRPLRNYVWFYNVADMHAFITYFHGDEANGSGATFTNGDRWFECHELFLGNAPTIKLFFDIEKVIPDTLLKEYRSRHDCSANDFGEDVCADVMKALACTLEEVDIRFDMYESRIDYAIAERCRSVGEGELKISYHLITNIAMRVSECKAVVKHMKENYLDMTVDRVPGYKDMLCDKTTIDTQPYRKNGSLSLPGGRKNGRELKVIRSFKAAIPAESLHLNDYYNCITLHDFTDDLPLKKSDSNREAFEESSSEFINKALAKLESDRTRIPAYDSNAMDLYANSPRGNYLRVARIAPSHFSECDRTHDNADTLLLIFNESKEIALWKCAHNEDMKTKRWFGKSGSKEYELAAHDDDEVEFFAKNMATRAQKAEEKKEEKKAEKAKEANERMSKDEALLALPKWDIKLDSKTIPPINDIHNPCCYADYLKMQEKALSGKQAMEYIFKNFALILNGGESFFISKNFNKRANGARVISHQYLKYKSIHNMPGSILVNVINPITKKAEEHNLSIFKLLIRWQSSIAYPEMRFSPFGAKVGYDWSHKEIFNTFSGFVHKYDPEFVVDETRIIRFLDHIRGAWCDDNEELFDFTVKLLAYMVQYPHLKTAVAMIVMGPEGLGKNFVMNLWRDHVIGKGYFFETPSIDAITGKFNAMLEGNLMVVLNEAAKVNKSIEANRAQEVMKDIITEETRRYERKGCEAYMGECFNNVICFSNNDYVVRASTEMRRFVFYKGSGRFIGQELEHFAPIKKDFEENDAGIHLYHYLMNINLTGFHPQRSAPSTKAKEELKYAAIEKPVQWVVACINQETEHTFVNTNGNHAEEHFYPSDFILKAFNAWMESRGDQADTTLKVFSKDLTKYLGDTERKMLGGVRRRGFTISINQMKEQIAKTARRTDLFIEE